MATGLPVSNMNNQLPKSFKLYNVHLFIDDTDIVIHLPIADCKVNSRYTQ